MGETAEKMAHVVECELKEFRERSYWAFGIFMVGDFFVNRRGR